MDCSLPGSSVHGIFQARVLEWGATAFSDSYSWRVGFHHFTSESLQQSVASAPWSCLPSVSSVTVLPLIALLIIVLTENLEVFSLARKTLHNLAALLSVLSFAFFTNCFGE